MTSESVPPVLRKFYHTPLTGGEERDIDEHRKAVRRLERNGVNYPRGGSDAVENALVEVQAT